MTGKKKKTVVILWREVSVRIELIAGGMTSGAIVVKVSLFHSPHPRGYVF